jgi:hypothetical protein
MSKSFDFSNNIRDVSTLFDTLVAQQPSLLGLLGSMSGSAFDSGDQVTNTKYEWVDDQLSPVSTSITGFDTDGNGTGINVTSTTGIIVNSLLRFESATGASRTVIVQVASVDSATDLTVTRPYGGSTEETLVVTDAVKLIATPLLQNTTAGSGLLHEGTLPFNYTEILDQVAEVSRTANQTASYDSYTQLSGQMKAAMVRQLYQIENTLIHGRKVAPSVGVPGSMGGLLQLIDGNIDSTGGAISQTLINNVLEEIASDGGFSNNYLLFGHPTQTRKISALNTGGTNPVVFKPDVVGQRLGNLVTSYVGDLPLMDGAMQAKVFSNWSMLQDQVLIIDLNRVRIKTMQGMIAMNAAQNGQDGLKERILTEITLEVKNGGEAHGKLTGLAL